MPLTLTPANPQPVERQLVRHGDRVLGEVTLRDGTSSSGRARWHACFDLRQMLGGDGEGRLPGVTYLAQGHGDTPAEAITAAIAEGRAYAEAYAARIEALAFIVESPACNGCDGAGRVADLTGHTVPCPICQRPAPAVAP